jgi:hypothetical protein
MGADEEGTHERLKAHFAQLVEPKIKEHRGHTVKRIPAMGCSLNFQAWSMRCVAPPRSNVEWPIAMPKSPKTSASLSALG